MAAARNKLTAQQQHIWTLRIVCSCLFFALLFAIYLVQTKLEELTVHVPPDLSQGATMQGGSIPEGSVFTFASYVMLSINDWENGADDFPTRISQYRCVVSEAFKTELEELLESKKLAGELHRARTVKRLGVYTPQHVNLVSGGSWVVWLDLSISETVNGVPVKATDIRYALRVVRDDRTCNPMGMMIDGYQYQPERL